MFGVLVVIHEQDGSMVGDIPIRSMVKGDIKSSIDKYDASLINITY